MLHAVVEISPRNKMTLFANALFVKPLAVYSLNSEALNLFFILFLNKEILNATSLSQSLQVNEPTAGTFWSLLSNIKQL